MPIHPYQSIVKIEGVEAPIKGFSFTAQAGGFGVSASVELAEVTLNPQRGDAFDLILKNLAGSEPKANLIKSGLIISESKTIAAKRQAGMSAPDDSLGFTATDKAGDRWTRAPETPVILYDPAITVLQDDEADTGINDESGSRVFAETRALASLDLMQILRFAYIEGLGLSDVVTNLPSYRVPRADFPVNTSFHAIAASYYSPFKPVVFEDDDRIFILDVYGSIPSSLLAGARLVDVDNYRVFEREKPATKIANAVLLTHKTISVEAIDPDALPVNVTQRTEVETQDAGTFGEAGWQQTTFIRHIAEIHDDAEDPDKITSEVIWRVEARTIGRDDDGLVRELVIDTQTDLYSNNWRLKLGYDKSVQAYLEDGNGLALMQQALTETNRIVWRPSIKREGEYEKVWEQTQTSGLVLVEGEGDEQTKTPAIDASRNRLIPSDGSAELVQLPISSVISHYRETAPDQIEISVQKIDHLANRVESNKTIQHTGTNSVRVRRGEATNTRQVLLKDADSISEHGFREPISFDAGFVQYEIAKELALRELAAAQSPRDTISCTLATFDGGLRRGSVRRVRNRAGAEKTVIVTGIRVEGRPVGRGFAITQSFEGVVI